VRIFGLFLRCLPASVAAWIGRRIGSLAYYFDIKHKSRAHANLKIAFAHSKSPNEIKRITKALFRNYGQNLIELFRLPLLTPERFREFVTVEGKENVTDALKKGKGVIMLAMHFGSWELASLTCVRVGFPYKVFVKPQKKYSRLDELLNSYRTGGGSEILERGSGTRDFVRSLKKNQVIGMVVDQGGRDGILVPFLNRRATMSVGAIRMGLKLGVPICFSVIFRENGSHHKMIVQKPFELVNTGNLEEDVITNLKKVTKVMESYIYQYPAEYMWFYKIWKYSDEAQITILSDGKVGHLRQSQSVARLTAQALKERKIKADTKIITIKFKNGMMARLFSVISTIMHPIFYQGRLESLKWFLTEESFRQAATIKTNFIVSCGSSIAGVNNLLSKDSDAKSIVILKPGLMSYRRFDLVVLPQHDEPRGHRNADRLVITRAAPNIITKEYLENQSNLLLNRYSHLKDNHKPKIGLLLGGDAKNVFISDRQVVLVIRQLKEVIKDINMDVLITTSRRTPQRLENLFIKELKKHPSCPLMILANRENVPEAVGGIMGLSELLIVSGDSISMVSEAASSGKTTIVFQPESRAKFLKEPNKYRAFAERLASEGHVFSTDVQKLGQAVYDIAKGKIQTKAIDDNKVIFNAVRNVI